jgi:hypothetical protein
VLFLLSNHSSQQISNFIPEVAIVYVSDDQLAARGPDPARGLIYSGPHQVTGLVRLVKVSISA